jgi:hypothetical protein
VDGARAAGGLPETMQVATLRPRMVSACAAGEELTYSVHYHLSLEAIPEEAQREIVRIMLQIAEVVSTVPGSSPFWSSMKDSLLKIDVDEWRVVYRIDPSRREIHIVELEPARR